MSTQGVLAGVSTDGFSRAASRTHRARSRATGAPQAPFVLVWSLSCDRTQPGTAATPGPRVAVSIEGTRSYGIGLARDAAGPDTDAGVDAV